MVIVQPGDLYLRISDVEFDSSPFVEELVIILRVHPLETFGNDLLA